MGAAYGLWGQDPFTVVWFRPQERPSPDGVQRASKSADAMPSGEELQFVVSKHPWFVFVVAASVIAL